MIPEFPANVDAQTAARDGTPYVIELPESFGSPEEARAFMERVVTDLIVASLIYGTVSYRFQNARGETVGSVAPCPRDATPVFTGASVAQLVSPVPGKWIVGRYEPAETMTRNGFWKE